MKNLFKVLGITVLAAVIGFSMAACDNGSEPGPDSPTVTSITVSAAGDATSVDLGGTLLFSAVVIGANSPPQGVTWSIVTTGTKPGTKFSSTTNGLLEVANDEIVHKLNIKATSTFNTNQSGYAAVDVNDSSKSTLGGNIFITVNSDPVTTATTGTELTASYSGSESVTFTYEWYIDGYNVGPNSNKYTPYEAGSYTVTISAAGYNNKTSGPVTVTVGGNVTPPEQRPDAASRWGKWVADDATATLDYSVANDGVCTITVGGTAEEWDRWKANAGYGYTANVNTLYAYTFQAWTQSGTRNLGVQYYVDNNDQVYKGSGVDITSTPETYTVKGERIPKGGVQSLEFQCADQLGTFYVKMLSIEPYEPELEYELVEEYGEWGQYNENYDTYRVKSAIGMSGAVVIPAIHSGKAVTEIGENAFSNPGITSISIPASVKLIGRDAFAFCQNLTSVTFASGSQLDSIGGYAFAWCPSLASITIPASVTFIGNAVFAGSNNLTNITVNANNPNYSSQSGILYDKHKTELIAYPSARGNVTNIPNSVASIGSEAFRDCESLTGVTIPSSVNHIGLWAFAWCPNIASITIPASVAQIEQQAFMDWTASQTIYIKGHASRQSTIDAEWGGYWWNQELGESEFFAWDSDCNANIVYQGQ